MLRTLGEAMRRAAHLHVRFLPIIAFILIAIFLPVSINNYFFQPSIAEGAFFDGLGKSLLNGLEFLLFGFIKIIALVIFKLTGVVFVMSGWMFENSVVYSLSGTLYSNFKFINVGWVFIRDLINSLFIFIVLFIAFKQLLKFDGGVDTGKLQKTLVKIILAALLINFSLFFTKAAIDVSNFLSRAIFYSMENRPSDGSAVSYGPANALVAGLNIQSLLKDPVTSGNSRSLESMKDNEMVKALVYIGGSAIHIIASIMFFTMAFFFLARILVLVILMLTSPIYFLGFMFDNKGKAKEYSDMWFKEMQNQFLFPIIFMLIIYIAVTFVNQGLLTKTSGESLSSALTGDASGFATIINFGIVLTIMYMATKMSRQYAGSYTKSMGEWMAGKAASAGFSATAWAGRNTLGAAGRKIAESGTAKRWASSNNRFKRLAGDSVIGGGKAMYEGNWDVRSAGPISDAYGFANANTHQLKVGGPTSRTAKANVPEWWNTNSKLVPKALHSVKSKEGQVKQAAQVSRSVESYNTVEAKVSKIRTKLGDNINNKEYKTVRESLIKEIKTTYKDKPETQAKLIQTLVGSTEYSTPAFNKVKQDAINDLIFDETDKTKLKGGKSGDELKAEVVAIIGEQAYDSPTFKSTKTRIDAERAKEGAKGISKDLEEIKNIDKQIKEAENAPVKDVDKIAKLKEDQTKVEAKVATTRALVSAAPPVHVAEIAAKDVVHFKDQLDRAKLTAINAKIGKGEYTETGDVEALNEMAAQMRKDLKQKNPKDKTEDDKQVEAWIKSQAEKGTSGFEFKLDRDVGKIMQGPIGTEEKKELEQITALMSKREYASLELEDIVKLSNMDVINLNRMNEYAKNVHQTGDKNQIAKLESESNAVNDVLIKHSKAAAEVSKLEGEITQIQGHTAKTVAEINRLEKEIDRIKKDTSRAPAEITRLVADIDVNKNNLSKSIKTPAEITRLVADINVNKNNLSRSVQNPKEVIRLQRLEKAFLGKIKGN